MGFCWYQLGVASDLRWDFRLSIRTALFPPHECILRVKGLRVNAVRRIRLDPTAGSDPSSWSKPRALSCGVDDDLLLSPGIFFA